MAGFLLLASGLVAGCIFSPDRGDDKKPPPPPIQYNVMDTPQAVLENLMLAYENRDSSGYLKLFELDYIGASYDTSEAEGLQPGEFTRIVEEAHIRGLAANSNITSVTLYLPKPWNPTTVISDKTGEEWAQIIIFNPQIGITDGPNSVGIVARETFDFQFRPRSAPPESSTTGKLWHIVRWTEAP